MRILALPILIVLVTFPADAQLVAPRSSAAQIVIPAAGSVAGSFGTFFHSDVNLINYRVDVDQKVRLNWLPQGVTGNGIAPVEIVIQKASGVISEDFVASVMHQSGLGAILVTAITDAGTIDMNGRLYATSRIWTKQPGSEGTVSQTFPALSIVDVSGSRQTIIGQRRDDRYRCNVGVVNLDLSLEQTYQIAVLAGTVQTLVNVPVPPMSMQQVSMTGVATSTLQIAVSNVTNGARNAFVSYGSSIDNTTGDSWSSLGFVSPPDGGTQ